MKRYLFLFAWALILIPGSIANAQDTTQTPAGQRQGGARGPAVGQRQGAPAQIENHVREAYLDTLTVGNRVVTLAPASYTITSTWWSNANTVAKLGLTDVQKSRIESTFEAHRPNLASRKEQLEKEEALLSRLLDAESIDRGSVFTQINRVVQARGEMERENAAMTLEMREHLTRAQWTQLQATQPLRLEAVVGTGFGAAGTGGGLGISTPPAGGRGGRGGARSGNPPQQ
jgi:Spy/CpxP family protein refolding chaperone